MKLVVTGGAGFIGNNFIRFWLTKYPKDILVNLDSLTYAGHLTSTGDFSSKRNYKFVKGTICDPNIVTKVTRGADCIVHFAAESHVDRSVMGPASFVKTNIMGTQVLLDAALVNKVGRFHLISTDEVFGSLALGSRSRFSEATAYAPRNPYAATKAAADHLTRAYHHTFGLPITITNCSNNFGPYQDPEKFIPRMITNLIDDKPIPIYGDGKNVRDWIYVEDHCRAIDKVIHKGTVGDTYVVGGLTKDINNLDVAKKLIAIFGRDHSAIKFVQDRQGHDRRYSVNWGKIKAQLKWVPKYDFDRWLVQTVQWYKDNEWWWRPLKRKSEKLYIKTGQV